MNETLFLTKRVIDFRKAYPELISQWEGQIGKGIPNPDLHFCFTLLEEFPRLSAYLRLLDYRIDFALNAYTIHSNLQQDLVDVGHGYCLALEFANHELQIMYAALNDSETIAENPKAKLYFDICDLNQIDASTQR